MRSWGALSKRALLAVSSSSDTLLVGVAYYVTAALSLELALVDDVVTPIWPPTGVAVFALLTFGRHVWPGIFAAALLVNLPITPRPIGAMTIAIGNTLAPVCAVHLLRLARFRPNLDRLRDVAALVLLAALGCMLISATMGSVTLALHDAIPVKALGSAWWVWWTGDAMGVLIVTPLLLALRADLHPAPRSLRRIAEACLLLIGLAIVSRVAVRSDLAILFLVFPFIIWASLRFQLRGAAPAALVVSVVGALAAVDGTGPFGQGPLTQAMLTLQIFNGSVSLTALALSSAVAGRIRERKELQVAQDQLERKVRQSAEELEWVIDRLDESRLRLAEAQQVAHVGSWEWDPATNRVSCSDELHRIFGLDPMNFISDYDAFIQRIHPDDRQLFDRTARASFGSGEPFSLDHRITRPDGAERFLRQEGRVDVDLSGRPFRVVGTGHDVTAQKLTQVALTETEEERKHADEQIAFMAFHDKLTGLANRAKFEELMEMAVARARRYGLAVAVLYLDLDSFKLVNDSLGHAAGDDLLREVAARLLVLTRETDVVARLGGDEFLVLLADLQQGLEGPLGATSDNAVVMAEAVASRIHDCLKDPFMLSDTELYISASVGISLFPMDAEDPQALLRNADAAMYRSKKAGPGGFALFPPLADDTRKVLSLATRLRKAVEREDWLLHYQPIIDLVRGEMVGVEGLLRWKDSEGRVILPGEFLPLAEELGFMERIGEWVMNDLFRQASEWRRKGLELTVSFNLSPRQLWHPELLDKLLGRLRVSGANPTDVVIEITESAAMADVDRTQHVLSRLRNGGLRFAIDDFGTGYSSLSRLRDLPVDILKIDRSFVRDVPSDQDAMTVVQAIIQLALSLGMTPLAEGIETEEQWRFMVDHGCRMGQGFYFQRPIPAEEIPALAGTGTFGQTPRAG